MRELVVPAGQTVSESGIELYGFRILSAPVGSSWTENDSPVSRAIVAAGEYRPSGWKRGSGAALRKFSFTAGAGGALRVELAVDADEWFGVMQPLQQTDANGNVLVASPQLPAALDANGNFKVGGAAPVRIANGTLANQAAGTRLLVAAVDLSPYRIAELAIGVVTLDAGTVQPWIQPLLPDATDANLLVAGTAIATGNGQLLQAGEGLGGLQGAVLTRLTNAGHRLRKASFRLSYAGGAGVNSVPWEVWGYP